MDSHLKEYYRQFSDETPHGNFHRVVALHESPHVTWKEVHELVPNMSKGWYELAHLPSADRIEFIRDYWFMKLSYCPHLTVRLNKFFASMDDICVFITQQKYDDPYEAQMVYSLKADRGYFHGLPPATDDEILSVQKLCPEYTLPTDYVAFMQIHNGFSKAADTGIVPTGRMQACCEQFQNLLASEEDAIKTQSGQIVDPATLIPFYESFGMPFYQCFWGAWYPEEEMGNVYYSGLTKRIPDVSSGITGDETLAFPTFTEWLLFYLELVDSELSAP